MGCEVNLVNDIIPIWVVIYDKDPDRTYVLNSFEQVIRSVEGALSPYLDNDSIIGVCKELESNRSNRYLFLRYRQNADGLIGRDVQGIDVFRIDLDHSSKIHSVLTKVIDRLDDKEDADLIIEMLDLFVDQDQLIDPHQSDF